MLPKYTVGFAGARDGYQVALALHEMGMLSQLVTDYYARPDWLVRIPRLGRLLARRHIPGLKEARVNSSWATLARARATPYLRRLYGRSPVDAQVSLSKDVLRHALKSGSSALVYAGYGRPALTDERMANKNKILFVYHPHVALAKEILLQDIDRHPEMAPARRAIVADSADRSIDQELAAADHIICASSFTAASLHHVGVDDRRISVVPYGIDSKARTGRQSTNLPRDRTFRVLFVGTGMHRKGVHILFKAWSHAKFRNAELTLVCRSMMPEVERLGVPRKTSVVRGVSREQLATLFQQSDVFVLPSLVEGFAYVYLEALQAGCFCIGTWNTGLPDLNCSPETALIVEAASADALESALAEAYRRFRTGELNRSDCVREAGRHSWMEFRSRIAEICLDVHRRECVGLTPLEGLKSREAAQARV